MNPDQINSCREIGHVNLQLIKAADHFALDVKNECLFNA